METVEKKIRLKEYLDEKGITVYRLNKELGNSNGTHSFLSQKIRGEKSISYVKLTEICQAISQITKKEITPKDFISVPVNVKL